MDVDNRTKEIVKGFLEAFNQEDFISARTFLSNDLKFVGVMGMKDGADTYIMEMEKMRLKYELKKIFYDQDGVAAFYDITMDGKKIFSAGWYEIENGKIKSIKVVFDPRPLLV